MGQRVSKLPAKLLDRSIANALNRVSAFDQRNQILGAEIYDDLLPARSHVLLRLLLELIERADEELPRGVEVERSSQHEQDQRAPLPESNVLVAGVIIKEKVE